MPKKPLSSGEFVEVQAVYQADVVWWWAEDKVHDSDYHFSVEAAMAAKLALVLPGYANVSQDTRFCCQGEGLRLCADNRAQVEAAANELARYLMRFKGVIPLGL